MNVIESLRVAMRGLVANKLRSALTMLGMIIGVGAVIALMSVGKGAQATIVGQIQGMGSNLLFVSPGAMQESGVRQGAGTAPTLTFDDAEAIANPDNVPSVVAVAPEMNNMAQVIWQGENTRTRVVGTTPAYEEVRNFHVAQGDFFTDQQVQSQSRVAVFGSFVAQQLFGDADPIDQTVKINNVDFRVVGVMETKGAQAMGNQDDVIFMPITTLQQRLFRQRNAWGQANVSTINVQVADEKLIDTAVQEIGDLLRERHKVNEDDFTVRSQKDTLSAMSTIMDTLTILLGSIAGISLVVGGIGIMNIMLVSVTERTREIGIRKAIGARRRDILMQFLVEAMAVSVTGGAVGIMLGAGLANALSSVSISGQTLRTLVSADSIILAFGVSAAIGLFFGIYPAARAAQLNPIQALRYE